MGNAKDLYGVSNNANMREAMKQLGSQFGIKDKNSFVQILLMGASSTGGESLSSNDLYESSKETNSSLQALSDAIISMQGEGKYVQQIVEIFENYVASNPDNDVATALLSDIPDATNQDNQSPPISFTVPDPPGKAKGFIRDVGITDIVPDINQSITFDKDHRSISVVEFHHPNLNFANRDSSAASVFLQALPSIEISKAVPYLDVKTIVKGGPTADSADLSKDSSVFTNGISIYKFLHGEKIEKSDSTVVTLASSVPREFANPSPMLQGGVGQEPVTKPGVTVAGMEIFTSPQTLVDGSLNYIDLDASLSNYGKGATPQNIPLENKALDKFRPLMTIKSFSVQVTPATGMLATKSADVKLTLHDKSRMNQIMPLIIPGQLGDVELMVEWGWSHPESNPDINPYGALINSMRCKEKYGLMNSSYSFTPEGQVEISLKLYTKGAQKATFELVSRTENGENPAMILRNLVFAIREQMKSLKQQGYTLNAEMGAPDILGKASSVGGLLSLTSKQRGEIAKFIKNMRTKSSGAASKTWKDLGNEFEKGIDGVEDFQKEIIKQFKKVITECTSKTNTSSDPYLLVDSKKVKGITRKVLDIKYSTHVSFAKVLLNFVAKPLLESSGFNEVQLLFYPMNEYAMFARDLNTGQYPINKKVFKELLEEELKKTPSISIQKFLNLMKKLFINYVGDDVYGLSQFYSADEEGKRGISKKYTKDEKAKQKFTEKKVKILESCYGQGNEKRFKKPSIQMWVECVPHADTPEFTILRLHFFDKACTSYSGYAQMWAAAGASDLGSIGKYTGAKRSLEHAEKQVKSVPKKERDKWKEIAAQRAGRVTQHEKNAEEQMKEFISFGLMAPYVVEVPVIDEKTGKPTGNTTAVTKYRIQGGPDQLRGILAANMPTLKYGTEYSGILNASLQTMSNPAMETIHMQRQGQSSGPSGASDNGLPMQVKPMELSLDTFGCPYINFGQQFFVDFQTNTSIDDIYAVSGVSHSLSPSEFKTSIKLSPLNKLGQFRAMTDQFDDAMAMTKEVGKNIED
jgi:hypothetical protein